MATRQEARSLRGETNNRGRRGWCSLIINLSNGDQTFFDSTYRIKKEKSQEYKLNKILAFVL